MQRKKNGSEKMDLSVVGLNASMNESENEDWLCLDCGIGIYLDTLVSQTNPK